jgi:hypothetical protein
MATLARRSTAVTVRRSGPSPKLVKAEATIKRLRSKARVPSGLEGQLATIGAPLVVGLLKARGTSLPTVAGFDSNFIWGLGLALAGPRIGGAMGKHAANAGVGLLAVAASRAGETGTLKTEGDFDDSDA